MPAKRQPKQITPRAPTSRQPRVPGFTLIRRYEPDTERQLEALALLLGIRLMPPSPQQRNAA